MIQLRWIFVPIGSGRGLVAGSDSQMYETVLQYREKADTGGFDVHLSDPWGPWEDVPIPGKVWPSGG